MPSQQSTQYKEILSRYLPQQAVDRIYDFVAAHGVQLCITRDRRSKLGDYRWPQRGCANHRITVNGGLNPYFFLCVMLHEMAHLDVYELYGRGVQPHGHEWQQCYSSRLMEYVDCFPQELAKQLKRYTASIPLKRKLQQQLEQMLLRYDPGYDESSHITLNDLASGSLFALNSHPDQVFKSIEKQRTRWRCEEVSTGRCYLVRGTAEVMHLQ